MDQSDEDSISRPVKSLLSQFEQLAKTLPNSHKRPTSSHGNLLPPQPTSPRPRAASNTHSDHHVPDVHQLRTSSSSSDLGVGARRPPPPPPSRGSKVPSPAPRASPSASPLLRPVPIPTLKNPIPDTPAASPRAGSSSLPGGVQALSSLQTNAGDPFVTSNVATLRNKLVNAFPPSAPKTLYSRGQGVTSAQPADPFEMNGTSVNAISKPSAPPRPVKSIQPSQSSLVHGTPSSPDDISFSTSASSTTTSSLHSPTLDVQESDSETSLSIAPPSLPARKLRTHHHAQSSWGSLDTQSSGSSRISSESDTSQYSAPASTPSRPTIIPPPRLPPRHQSPTQPSNNSPVSLLAPPPLPARRNVTMPMEEPQATPRLSTRPQQATPATSGAAELTTQSPDRAFGSQRLPPPPTRIIALGDKLPPARRPASPSSDEDSGEEDGSKGAGVDCLPDSSRSSRRPPVISFPGTYSESKVHVPAHSGHVAVSGNHVIATHRHIKIFDLTVSDSYILNLDAKDLGLKDLKVTSIEFRHASNGADRGSLVWLGTKEGHILELDIRTGVMTNSKFSAHLHPVTHIFRHGRSMVTCDDSGKVLIFDPPQQQDVHLVYTHPRVVRIAERQEFVKILGGMLWTATRADLHNGGGAPRTPIIRVYDIFTPGNVWKSVLPIDHVGAVTSATILPTQSGYVYVGHEGGYVTLWALETEDGFPQCVEVMKVSTSDVLSLEGVNDRLWAGGRNGMISAYDTTSRPWVVTNCWMAHNDVPVLKLSVDHYGIDKTGKLCVVSVGRDEQLRLWDGLLGSGWVDHELSKRETEFSTFRDLNVLIVSWNVDAAKPDSLQGDPANMNFLNDVLSSVNSPDIISFGFQEVIDLESRKLAAKNVLLSKMKPDDGGLMENITGAYKRWHDRLVQAVRLAMPPRTTYSVTHTEGLVGLFSCIFVKDTERRSLKDVAVATVKRGMRGRYGNKGGILSRFVIEDSSVCLINCHLAAGQRSVRQRNADVAAMLEEKTLFPVTQEPVPYVGGGDASMVLDHEIVFVNGDMNYRIDQRRDPLIAAIRADECDTVLVYDQLLKEMKFNRNFRFRGFSEGPLTFPPTYKYDRYSDEYDSSEKRRSPAWCDRVLWRSRIPPRVHLLHYQRYEPNVSDHRPISAGFTMTIKRVKHEVRQRVQSEIELKWCDEQHRLLSSARQFYVMQSLI